MVSGYWRQAVVVDAVRLEKRLIGNLESWKEEGCFGALAYFAFLVDWRRGEVGMYIGVFRMARIKSRRWEA